MSEHVQNLTDNEFLTKVEASNAGVVLVDFWAEWCGPCRALGPTIEQIGRDYAGKVKVYKVNVDENPSSPEKYRVRGIPTVVLFKDGQLVKNIVGAHPISEYQAALKEAGVS